MKTPFKCLCCFVSDRFSGISQKKKILPLLPFLCRSCGLLSNQPDPWTQPRSMDPDHMANRVPNRLCHLSLLNKKQTHGLVRFSWGDRDQVGRLPAILHSIFSFVYIRSLQSHVLLGYHNKVYPWSNGIDSFLCINPIAFLKLSPHL